MALARDEEVALARLALAGDRSAEGRLVCEHLALVRSLLKPFRDRGLDVEDLEQIGMLAVLGSVRRFDLDRGARLSTYATPRIRKAMQKAVAAAERNRLDLVDSYDRIGPPAIVDPEPEESLLVVEVEAACEACLTADERAVVGMHYGGVRGLSYGDISLMTGRSKQAVGRTKRRAVAKLKRHLQPAA